MVCRGDGIQCTGCSGDSGLIWCVVAIPPAHLVPLEVLFRRQDIIYPSPHLLDPAHPGFQIPAVHSCRRVLFG